MASLSDHPRIIAGELLAWHLAAGVDAMLDDAPHNRFLEAARDSSGPSELVRREPGRVSNGETGGSARVIGAASPRIQASPADDWVREARARASTATTLDDLRTVLANFDGCALSRTAKSLILADRVTENGILVIGDVPEADDDRNGEAFIGRPGALLDAMMKAIDVARNDLVLTTAIPWRPPGNRAPTVQELEVCTPFLVRQVELVKPRFILALGALPVQLLVGRSDSIGKLRGHWFDVEANGHTTKLMACLSPAYLLRQPMQKKYAWRDLKSFRQALSVR